MISKYSAVLNQVEVAKVAKATAGIIVQENKKISFGLRTHTGQMSHTLPIVQFKVQKNIKILSVVKHFYNISFKVNLFKKPKQKCERVCLLGNLIRFSKTYGQITSRLTASTNTVG